jgi:ABC-type uncharacterized transport system fused permease/ATPase subunit
MTDSSSSGRQARPEAGPLSWSALQEDQQRAVRKLNDLLRGIVAEQWTPPARSFCHRSMRPPVDQSRRGNTLFIDGGRGTGKSTVLLTLVRMWAADTWPESAKNVALFHFISFPN